MRPINSSLFQAVTRPKAFLNSRKRKRPRPISGHYRHVRQASCAAAMVRLGFAWLMSLLYFLLLSFFRLVAFSLFLGLTYYCAFFLFQLFFIFFFFFFFFYLCFFFFFVFFSLLLLLPFELPILF